MLPTVDEAYLQQKALKYVEVIEDGALCIVIHEYPLPPGYDRATTDLLLRLPAGYPDAQPDMFWCDPPIHLAELIETHLGRQWQRFSRHLSPGVWTPGVDSLGTFLTLIGAELARSTQPR
jgi:hypothetical protein